MSRKHDDLIKAAVVGLLAIAAAATGGAAASESGADPFVVRVFGTEPGQHKVWACFTRTYDAGHLAQHAKQRVSAMQLLLRAERDADTKEISYRFTLGLKLRDRAGQFTSSGGCGRTTAAADPEPDGAYDKLACSIDCDGGGSEVSPSSDAKSALVTLTTGGIKIWQKELDPEHFAADAEDRLFRLDRAKLADCLPLADDKAEAAAMRRGN
jgi:hypothetical protein